MKVNYSITGPTHRVTHLRKQSWPSWAHFCSCGFVPVVIQWKKYSGPHWLMHKEYVNNLSDNEQFTSQSLQMTFIIYHLSSRGANGPQPESKSQQIPTADDMGWDCFRSYKISPRYLTDISYQHGTISLTTWNLLNSSGLWKALMTF